MNQPRQILKNTIVLTFSDLIDKVGGIVLTLIIARLLHAQGLGVYATAMTYYSLIALAGAMGSTNFLVREIAKDLSQTNRYVVHLAVLSVALSGVITALVLLILPWLPYSAELTQSLSVIILAVIPGTLVTIQEAVFVAHQRTEFVTVTKLISTLVNLLISLVLLWQGFGVVGLLVAFVVEQYLVMFCYFVWINRFITRLQWMFDRTYLPVLVSEIKTFAALSLLAGLFARPEVILLSLLKTDVDVGYYSAALKIVNLWYFMPQIFMTNVFPVLARAYHQADQRFQLIQNKSVQYLLVITLPLTVGMMVVAAPIVDLFNGPGFAQSTPILQVLAWSLPCNALIAVLWRVLAARNQQKLDLQTRVLTLFLRLASNYLLIARWAAWGAAWSTVATLAFNVLLLLYYVNRGAVKIDLVRLGWRSALAAGVMGTAIWWLVAIYPLWMITLLAGVVYGAAILALRSFSLEDQLLLQQAWRPRLAPKER